MKALIKRFQSNNKGDTLAIVLVGMIIVAVLGTVILKASSVNVNMKITNLKNKQNFYYVEKAVDDVYAGIGKIVTDSVRQSYDESVQKMVQYTGGTYKVDYDGAEQNYLKNMNNLLKGEYDDVDNLINKLNEPNPAVNEYINISSYASDYNVAIKFEKTTDTAIIYEDFDPPVPGTVKSITIKDVVVKSSSLSSGSYEASITTDFVIEVPELDFNFNDTKAGLDEFFKYAIVADGKVDESKMDTGWYDGDDVEGAVRISDSSNVEVYGNIFGGGIQKKLKTNGMNINKPGINVNRNSNLSIYGANVVSRRPFVVGTNASVSIYDEDLTYNSAYVKKAEEANTSRVWAQDLLLEGNSASLSIQGDCFIKDDLEVNGNSCTVDIKGSYYGFGFQEDPGLTLESGVVAEADSNENRLSGSTNTSKFSNESSETVVHEHELRSAVIVNGNDADVKLTDSGDPRQFVLGGRAYIDLSGTTGTDSSRADYMTGESVSIKGNQRLYLVNDFSGSEVKANPVDESDLSNVLPATYTSDQFYQALKLDKTKIIAKRINTTLYFYNRQTSPDVQTEWVANNVASPMYNYGDMLVNAVASMGVKNLSLGANTKSYTVGTAMQVKDNKLVSTDLPYLGKNDPDEPDTFVDIVLDVRKRYNNMMYDFDDDRTSAVGDGKVTDHSGGSSNSPSPYDNFIDDEVLKGRSFVRQYNLHNIKNSPPGTFQLHKDGDISGYPAGTDIDAANLLSILKNEKGKNPFILGLQTLDNLAGGGTSTAAESIDGGVIICTGNVTINHDFEGMVICGGTLTIQNNCKFTANPALMELLRNNSPYLQALINRSASPSIGNVTGNLIGVVDDDDGKLTFDTFVTMKNWRKNAD